MLLLDGGPVLVPHLSDLGQPLLEQFHAYDLRRVPGQGVGQLLIGRRLIERQASAYPRFAEDGQVGRRRRGRGRRRRDGRLLERIAAAGLHIAPELHGVADAVPLALAGQQPADCLQVVLRVEAMAAGRPLRGGQVIAALPSAQRIGLDARFPYNNFQVVARLRVSYHRRSVRLRKITLSLADRLCLHINRLSGEYHSPHHLSRFCQYYIDK